jgi:hypothetical protein
MTDNNGYVRSPFPVAPVNEADMLLLPEGLNALKKVAKLVGLVLTGVYLNLGLDHGVGHPSFLQRETQASQHGQQGAFAGFNITLSRHKWPTR